MFTTYQFEKQNMLQHGYSVYLYFMDLLTYLKEGKSEINWILPRPLLENKEDFVTDLSEDIIFSYLLFHDVGKPFCKTEVEGC
jgi:hypothetical protein